MYINIVIVFYIPLLLYATAENYYLLVKYYIMLRWPIYIRSLHYYNVIIRPLITSRFYLLVYCLWFLFFFIIIRGPHRLMHIIIKWIYIYIYTVLTSHGTYSATTDKSCGKADITYDNNEHFYCFETFIFFFF